jgi:hypothetical protein
MWVIVRPRSPLTGTGPYCPGVSFSTRRLRHRVLPPGRGPNRVNYRNLCVPRRGREPLLSFLCGDRGHRPLPGRRRGRRGPSDRHQCHGMPELPHHVQTSARLCARHFGPLRIGAFPAMVGQAFDCRRGQQVKCVVCRTRSLWSRTDQSGWPCSRDSGGSAERPRVWDSLTALLKFGRQICSTRMGNPRGLKQSLAKGVGKESVRTGGTPAIIGISGKNCFRALSPDTFPLDTSRPARALAM